MRDNSAPLWTQILPGMAGRLNLLGCWWRLGGLMRDATAGRSCVRGPEGGPQLPFNPPGSLSQSPALLRAQLLAEWEKKRCQRGAGCCLSRARKRSLESENRSRRADLRRAPPAARLAVKNAAIHLHFFGSRCFDVASPLLIFQKYLPPQTEAFLLLNWATVSGLGFQFQACITAENATWSQTVFVLWFENSLCCRRNFWLRFESLRPKFFNFIDIYLFLISDFIFWSFFNSPILIRNI